MAPRLVVPQALWSRLRAHLLRDNDEHLAFLLARWEGDRLLTRSLELISDDGLGSVTTAHGFTLRPEWLVRVINAAIQQDLALIEAHNHPGANTRVAFSPQDLSGQRELAAYLAGHPVTPAYGALVLGDDAVAGQLWPAGSTEPMPLGEVFVPGDVIHRWSADSGPPDQASMTDPQFDRQIRAIGEEGQHKLQQAHVAVVGLGGTGSIVAQELAHLGIGRLTLIDNDRVETSNLNRVVGASAEAVGHRKVDVAADVIRHANRAVDVRSIGASLFEATALAVCSDADVIIGCVDTDAARLIATVLAQAYLVPYIDCGVGITVRDRRVVEAGGRVVVWVPGRPCLLCCREIDLTVAAQEMESPRERAFREAHGYVVGAQVRDPAVISLNGTIGSVAVTELVALLTGLRAAVPYTYYDLLEQRTGQRLVKRDKACPVCALQGLGAAARLDHYIKREFPGDLPTLN